METLSFVSKTRTPRGAGAGASLVNVTTCARTSCDVMRCSIEGSPLRDVGDAARAARRPSVSHLHLVVVVVWEEGVFLSLQTR